MKKIFIFLIAFASLQADLSEDTTKFAFSLYSEKNENCVFSPYSIFSCLSMAYMGAENGTALAIAKALHTNMKPQELVKALSSHASGQFHIANGMWISDDIQVLPSFRKTIENDFLASVQTLDFRDSQESSDIINEWISEQTQGKIPSLLSPGDLDESTKLVLTNAIYFKGAWKFAFDSKATHPGSFWIDENTASKALMMEQTHNLLYFENDSFQLLALPFAKSDVAFLALLPRKGENVELSADLLQKSISSLSMQRVSVTLPKFSLNQRIDLNQALSALGMASAFTPYADFSGINGKKDLFFSKVVHQAFFDLDEAGVTAAAATAIGMSTTNVHAPATEFIADHPFIFFLIDMKSKIPLFMGKLINPCK